MQFFTNQSVSRPISRWGVAICLAGLSWVFATAQESVQQESPQDKAALVLDVTMKKLAGTEVDLAKEYQGKVVLVVNVASKCGLTPQYEQLQSLYEKYRDQGLVVAGFPCNQFGGQEPGNPEEIRSFCTKNYGVTFDVFAKIEVNGDSACELYQRLTSLDVPPAGTGKITWNFEKFLVDRSGNVVRRFAPRTKPDDPQVIEAIESLLESKG